MSGRLTVLIAEDDIDKLAALQSDILDLHFDVRVASDGLQALSIINEEAIDIVLSDFYMPHLTGLQLLVVLREQGHRIPFIILSGNDLRYVEHELIGLGIQEVLTKPVHFDELRSSLDRASQHVSAISSLRVNTRGIGDSILSAQNGENS